MPSTKKITPYLSTVIPGDETKRRRMDVCMTITAEMENDIIEMESEDIKVPMKLK